MRVIAILIAVLVGAHCRAQVHTVRDSVFLRPATNAPAYQPNATDFDGANDFMARGADLTGNADGKKGTVSFWVKFGDDSELFDIIWTGNSAGAAAGIYVYREAQRRMFVDAYNAAGVRILGIKTSLAFTFSVADNWKHFVASWDLATGTGQIYVNGNPALEASPTLTDDTIDYTQSNHGMGAFLHNGASKVTACISDFYLNLAEHVDLSANLAKFFINGNPVDLGADGSTPTGTAPIVFLKNAFGTWQNNLGSGGNFTVTGTLTACSDAP